MEGRTDLYRLDNDTLTAIRYLDYTAASFFPVDNLFPLNDVASFHS